MVEKSFLKKIKKEIKGNKRIYLENCKRDPRYIDAAQIIFKKYYKRFDKLASIGQKYNAKAIEFKEKGNLKKEKSILKRAVKKNVNTPYSYERLCIIYEKEKKYQKAYNICKKWFNSPHWKIPNMATGSLKLLDRLGRLTNIRQIGKTIENKEEQRIYKEERLREQVREKIRAEKVKKGLIGVFGFIVIMVIIIMVIASLPEGKKESTTSTTIDLTVSVTFTGTQFVLIYCSSTAHPPSF